MNTESSTVKFSVIIPVYNREKSIAQAIDSVLAQTFNDYEIIVCDDGSTDKTLDILEIYCETIKIVHTAHVGPGGARNAAIAVASGQYIACLDSDDFWAPWALACVVSIIDELGKPIIVYFRPYYTTSGVVNVLHDFNGSISYGLYESFLSAPTKTVCSGSAIAAIPRNIFLQVGGFHKNRINSEDRDLALKLSRYAQYVILESPVCVYYKEHDGQISKNSNDNIAGWKVIGENYCQGIYGPLSDGNLSGYMAHFFIGLVIHLLQKGDAGKDTKRFFTIAQTASFKTVCSWVANRKMDAKGKIVFKTICLFYCFLPMLLLGTFGLFIIGRAFDWLIGLLKSPEHKAFLKSQNILVARKTSEE